MADTTKKQYIGEMSLEELMKEIRKEIKSIVDAEVQKLKTELQTTE